MKMEKGWEKRYPAACALPKITHPAVIGGILSIHGSSLKQSRIVMTKEYSRWRDWMKTDR
jgi:hypothetical protein